MGRPLDDQPGARAVPVAFDPHVLPAKTGARGPDYVFHGNRADAISRPGRGSRARPTGLDPLVFNQRPLDDQPGARAVPVAFDPHVLPAKTGARGPNYVFHGNRADARQPPLDDQPGARAVPVAFDPHVLPAKTGARGPNYVFHGNRADAGQPPEARKPSAADSSKPATAPYLARAAATLLKHGSPPATNDLNRGLAARMLPYFEACELRCGKAFPGSAPWPASKGTGLTVELWVKLQALDEPTVLYKHGNAAREVFIDAAAGEAGVCLWRCGVKGGGGSSCSVVADPTGAVGKWTHLAAVFDEPGRRCSLLVNGELSTVRSACLADLWSLLDEPPCIGYGTVGFICHVKVWSVARSDGAVRREMRRQLRGDEEGLVGYWTLLEGLGGVLFDRGRHRCHALCVPARAAPEASGPFRLHLCSDLPVDPASAMASCPKAYLPVVDTNFDTSPVHLAAYSNSLIVGLVGAPSAGGSAGSVLVRYYSVETGCVVGEESERVQACGFEPHCVFYDEAGKKVWTGGVAKLDAVICGRGIAGCYTVREMRRRASAYAAAKGSLPGAGPPAVALELLHACDWAALALSNGAVMRAEHPLCVAAEKDTLDRLLGLVEAGLTHDDAAARYTSSVGLRLMKCNFESVLACDLSPAVIGFGPEPCSFGSRGDPCGTTEARLWHALSRVFERHPSDPDAVAVLEPALRLLLRSPAAMIVAAAGWSRRQGGAQCADAGGLKRRSSSLLSRGRPDDEGELSDLEKTALVVLLRWIARLPNTLVAIRSSSPAVLLSKTPQMSPLFPGTHSFAADSNVHLSNVSFNLRSNVFPSSSSQQFQLSASQPRPHSFAPSVNLTTFIVLLVKRAHAGFVKYAEDQLPDRTEPVLVQMLASFQKSLVALAVREAAATNVCPEEADAEYYPGVLGQLVAYGSELVLRARDCFAKADALLAEASASGVADDGKQVGCIERHLRRGFVGVLLPPLLASFGLLIGTADLALLNLLPLLEDCQSALSRFLRHLPSAQSRPSTGVSAAARPHACSGEAEPLMPAFLQPRQGRKGVSSSKKASLDTWADLQHSLMYVMVRSAGHVAASGQQPASETGYDAWFSSPVMRAGLSTRRDLSRKAQVSHGFSQGTDAGLHLWNLLKRNHISNKINSAVLSRAVDVDRTLRTIYAAVLYHTVPQADFHSLKNHATSLPVGLVYAFSKVESLITRLMELKQVQGLAALLKIEQRALLLLRFEPAGFLPTPRDMEMRTLLAPASVDRYAAGAAESSSKVNNWKRLFLSWKALRSLQQLLRVTQMHLDPQQNVAHAQPDIVGEVINLVMEPLLEPGEVDVLLHRRCARGRQRAKGLEHLIRLIQACPDDCCLLDCLIVTVKVTTGHHHLDGLAAAGSVVQGKVTNAMYSLIEYAIGQLGKMADEGLLPGSAVDGENAKEASCNGDQDPAPGGTSAPKTAANEEVSILLMQLLAVPWQTGDIAYLVSSKLLPLLSTLLSILPPHLAKRGSRHATNSYIPPGTSLESIPIPSHINPARSLPSSAFDAVLEEDTPPCITLSPDCLKATCRPSPSSLRGAVAGNIAWQTNAGSFTLCKQSPVYYFEVTIHELSDLGAVAVGIGPLDYDRTRHPGWGYGSSAYHGDDGMLFQGTGKGRPFGPTFGVGCTVGCGLVTATKEAFWTVNGRLLPVRAHVVAADVKPLVGIDARGALSVNFGAEPLRFDVSLVPGASPAQAESEVKVLAWQLLRSLSLRAAALTLQLSDSLRKPAEQTQPDPHPQPQQPPHDAAFNASSGSVATGHPAPLNEPGDDVVIFDQVCSPVHRTTLKSPRMRFAADPSAAGDKLGGSFDKIESPLILSTLDPYDALCRVMSSAITTATVEIARCVALWDVVLDIEPLTSQISQSCALLASVIHGASQDTNPDTADQLINSLVSLKTPYHLLRSAGLDSLPPSVSHTALNVLSLFLPGLPPAQAAASLSPPGCDCDEARLQSTLHLLMQSAGRCLPFTKDHAPAPPRVSSARGSLRLLAMLARSPTWHESVISLLEDSLEKRLGPQYLLTALAVVGGLREQLGVGSLVEYCSEDQAIRERAHIIGLDYDTGFANIVNRSLNEAKVVSLSAISLPDPFDWHRMPAETKQQRAADAGPDGKKDPWTTLCRLLSQTVAQAPARARAFSLFDENLDSAAQSAVSMMVIRAAWVNVRSNPVALKWLVTSGLLSSIVRKATEHTPGELPLEAVEEKVLMLHTILAEVGFFEEKDEALDKEAACPFPPLRFFASTHLHGSPVMSPVGGRRVLAAEGVATENEQQDSQDQGSVTPGRSASAREQETNSSRLGEEDEEMEEQEEEDQIYDDDTSPDYCPSDADPPPHPLDESNPPLASCEAVSFIHDPLDESDTFHHSYPPAPFNDDAPQDASRQPSKPVTPHPHGLRFTNGILSLGAPPRLSFPGPLTIDFTLKIASVDSTPQMLVHRSTGDGDPAMAIQLETPYQIAAGWIERDGTKNMVRVHLPVQVVNRWVHVAAVYDGASWILHCDGFTSQDVFPSGPIRFPQGEWVIGGCVDSAEQRMKGDVKNFRIWQAALSARKIEALAKESFAAVSGNALVCHFRFREREGRLARSALVGNDFGRLTAELWGELSWVGGAALEVEEELDLTSLNDGDCEGITIATSRNGTHACVDRASLWAELRRIPKEEFWPELIEAQGVVGCLYARALVVQTIANWPDDVPMSADHFGSISALCDLLRVLTDSGQSSAVQVIKSHIPRMLQQTDDQSNAPLVLLNDCLTLTEQLPKFVVRHLTPGVTRSFGVPGVTQYRVLAKPLRFDRREALIIAADPECKRVISRTTAGRPWIPLTVNLPGFFFRCKASAASLKSHAGQILVQYGFHPLELGLSLLEQLMTHCNGSGRPVPEPLLVFHALSVVATRTLSYHRRLSLSLIRQLVCNPSQWPGDQTPCTSSLFPLKRALERQYRREEVNGGCVVHSKFVQSLAEVFLAVQDAGVAWERMRADESRDLAGDGRSPTHRLIAAYIDGEPAPDDSLKVDTDAEGRLTLWPAVPNLTIVVRSPLLPPGKWYYEACQLTARGIFAFGASALKTGDSAGPHPLASWHSVAGLVSAAGGQPAARQTPFDSVRRPIGVEVDTDASKVSFFAADKALGTSSFAASDDHVICPSVWVSAKDGIRLNLGGAPFDMARSPRCMQPMPPSVLSLSNALPLDQLRALTDTSFCLLRDHPVPPYFRDSTDHFKNVPHRSGPQYVELIATDGVLSNGLECRNTGTAFYTVKANVRVQKGRWYYEVVINTHGLMQIGWVTDSYRSKPVSGIGVGDDEQSWAIDLFRRHKWHRNQPIALSSEKWVPGDVVGCFLAVDDAGGAAALSFSLNGAALTDEFGEHLLFQDVAVGDGLSPAASLRANTGCTFNFGGTPLKHQPADYRALGVADTWLERIGAFYASAGPGWAEEQRQQGTRRHWGFAKDVALVGLINELCRAQRKNLHQVTLSKEGADAPLWEDFPAISSADEAELLERVAVLKKFNRIVCSVMPVINFEMASRPSSVASALLPLRGLLFKSVADNVIKNVVKATNAPADPMRITLNRRKAARHRQHPEQDATGRSSLYGQTYELLSGLPPSVFQTNQRFWTVTFTGEGAEDVGGPYREHITEMCAELMSDATPLFIPSPNQRSGVGPHRDCFVPAPSASTPLMLGMFDLLGRLMGGAIRSNEPLSLYLPPFVWKKIVGQAVAAADLDGFDRLCYQCVENLASLSATGVTEDMYNRTFTTETFSTQLSDGAVLDLIHDGSNVNVTYDRLTEYASLVSTARLNESSLQIDAIRKGLCRTIPEFVFHLITGGELEAKVCGKADFTVRELSDWTTLDGLTKTDRRVLFLWQVLEEITAADRRAFLRFVAGRERLPVKLRVMPLFCKGPPDTYLPKAATCFFALELPDYSTVEVMREKLLYAIKHCVDIDTDFRAREFDEDEAPQLVFDEPRHAEHEMIEMGSDSGEDY
ncbi:putative E3 ubiquitin-protein ligase HERC2 [Diplonema papillatum]|nr:putative E3 ubiquitin-protein ligase HERC2 [Diplonema papillatum]